MTCKVVAVVVVLLSIPCCLLAQSTSATITGRIIDQSKAAIVGANVVATNVDTRVQQSTTTGPEGLYTIVSLMPGNYKLEVQKQGFRTVVKPDIVLHVQDVSTINFEMSVGAISESITVTGGAPLVNTESAAVSTVVDRKYVENMPLNGRSFQDLVLLTPGVVTTSPQSGGGAVGTAGEFSVNGQRTDSNSYSVDGVSANVGASVGEGFYNSPGASGSVAAATALGTTQALVSVDALEEFRVQSSTYSADYGRNPGGQFAFVTRSGTNEWHGTGFDYLRNNVFDANDWFNDYFGLPAPPLRQNDFGGTLGGPVEIPGLYDGKNKTFFFVSYEGLRVMQPQAAGVSYVPDAVLRQSAPSALAPVLNAFPVANGPDLGNGLAEFIGTWSNPSSIDAYSIRLDQTFNDRLKLFFRFSDTPSSAGSRSSGNYVSSPASLTTSNFTARSYTLGATSAFTSHINNDFRLNYSSNQATSASKIDAFGGNDPASLSQLQGVGPDAFMAFVFPFSGYEAVLSQNQQSGIQRQWNLVNTTSLIHGRHQIRFGVDYRRLTPIATPFSPYVQYVYPSATSVQTNIAAPVEGTSYSRAYPLYTNFSAFAQDEWKLTPRLNLSMGLRWEVNPAPGVTQGLMPYSAVGSSLNTLTLAPQGTPLWRTGWFNFAPRLGAAYILRSEDGWETVLRGGGGVFFDSGQQLGSLGFSGVGFNATNEFSSAAFPVPVPELIPAIVNPPASPYYSVYSFPSHLQLPYTLQWNASLQQALGKSQAATISYVGSHASKLLAETEYSGSAIGNPNIQNLFVSDNRLTSDYDALQIQFQRRLSRGLTALASFTWSHCIDYGSTDITLGYGYFRGDCDFDVRHGFSSAFSYDLPDTLRNRPARAMLHHWGIDGRFTVRSSFPVTLLGNQIVDPATGQLYFTGLNLVPGQPAYIYGSQCTAIYNNGLPCPGGRAINPNAFSLPANGEYGNAGRNSVRGFGVWQMDLAIRREFPIYERLKLQFRAEAFNIFNHPNFGFIDPFFGDTTFGQATGTLASTLGVLSPLYQMGAPRSMQFALKLTF